MSATPDYYYSHLKAQPGDYLRGVSTITQSKDQWIFKSNLPTTIHLFVSNERVEMKKITTIPPLAKISFDANTFSDGDTIHTYYIPTHDPKSLVMLMPPHTLHSFYKTVTLGGVTYTTDQGHGEYQSSSKDLSGIWLENKLAIPIVVYYEGLPVVALGQYNGLNYLGGGANVVLFKGYMDNGLNYGDQLTFAYKGSKGFDVNFLTATISDINCRRMFIGVTTSGYEDPRAGFDNRYEVP